MFHIRIVDSIQVKPSSFEERLRRITDTSTVASTPVGAPVASSTNKPIFGKRGAKDESLRR